MFFVSLVGLTIIVFIVHHFGLSGNAQLPIGHEFAILHWDIGVKFIVKNSLYETCMLMLCSSCKHQLLLMSNCLIQWKSSSDIWNIYIYTYSSDFYEGL